MYAEEFVADRILLLSLDDGSTFHVHASVGKPYADANGNWRSDIRIETPEGVETWPIPGADSLDALILAIWALERKIDILGHRYKDKIVWGDNAIKGERILRTPDSMLHGT